MPKGTSINAEVACRKEESLNCIAYTRGQKSITRHKRRWQLISSQAVMQLADREQCLARAEQIHCQRVRPRTKRKETR